MNLLLDTQALLWFLLDDLRLSQKGRELMMRAERTVFVSPASLWEIAIKISLGKYTLPEPFEHFWNRQLQENALTLLPITLNHTSRIINLPFHHKDPFDRLLIAQSLEEQVPIVSSDAIFDAYGVHRLW
ncbi:PIN domain nuclease, a component of toxin-antitoxin system (PIN domain) [Desulfonatronum thiosulfatophilum]|uniref:PIN domain nuclease, a component of toxin-antitoxin system (PIN domain) n=1 Tax=Desulfonatronum thiosulfatophilum TaxID=617002 RepID=A0A1G6DSC8_9BACT|nr:type II toxin-antitoxin system VapC family toxin [Desulfonatronum thiosulfatophilum]SDB48093.1 PIN domain nuclease, a component of toxin-antitoxin system (PIN domain) [Desulfonatronum thiosulfatophilum]